MKLRNIFALIIFLLIAETTISQGIHIIKTNVIKEKDGKSYYIHTVSKGQTLYSIAKAYNVTMDEIYYENPDIKDSNLKIGQKIWIPTINKETELTTERNASDFDYFYHITSENETFKKLSDLYNVPEKYIRLANPNSEEPFKTGNYIKIPIESSFPILDGKVKKTDYKLSSNTNVSEKANNDVSLGKNKKDIVSFDPNVKVAKFRHIVSGGETLYGIARKYHISVDDLRLVNPNLVTIKPGDRLRLPYYAQNADSSNPDKKYTKEEVTDNKTQIPSKYFKYKVKKGDNIFKISRKFGISLDDLYDANPALLSSKIFTGKELLIPKVKTKPEYVYYKVPYKTKIKKVARLYGLSKSKLKTYNPTLKNRVYPGQVVKIPAGEYAVLLPENTNIKPEETVAFPEDKNKKTKCIPSPDKYTKFNIAIMVPLFLDEMEEIDYEMFVNNFRKNFKPFWYIKFLEGAMIAIDSLEKEGYKLNISIYDIDDKVTKTIKTLKRPELKNMDMIIGPFYSKSFDQVAIFAENFGITVVNPFTFREEMLDKYNNIIKIKPGAESQVPLLKKLVENYYKDYKVFLITQNAYKDANIVDDIKNSVLSALPEKVKIPNIDINNLSIEVMNRRLEEIKSQNKNFSGEVKQAPFKLEGNTIIPDEISENMFDTTSITNKLVYVNYMKDSIHPVENFASPIRKNLIIIYGENKSFLMDVLNRLNVLRDTFEIELIGMPYWETLKRPDFNIFNNLNLTYFSSYYINYEDESVNNYVEKFKTLYNTIPESYGFAGFDITWFFIKALADYNDDFKKCLPNINSMMFENGYSFQKKDINKTNFENVMWNILKINDYKIYRLPESNLIPVDNIEK